MIRNKKYKYKKRKKLTFEISSALIITTFMIVNFSSKSNAYCIFTEPLDMSGYDLLIANVDFDIPANNIDESDHKNEPIEVQTEEYTKAPVEITEENTQTYTEAPTTESVNQEPIKQDPAADTKPQTIMINTVTANNYLSDDETHDLAIKNQGLYADMTYEMATYINNYRTRNNLPELAVDTYINMLASHRATEQAYSKWFCILEDNTGATRHIRPNGTFAKAVKDYYGCPELPYAEIMARRFPSCQSTLEGWKNSSAHNKAILSSQYSKMGIGIAQDDEGDYYFIVVFSY